MTNTSRWLAATAFSAEEKALMVDGTGASGRRAPAKDEGSRLMRLGRTRRQRGACLAAAMFAGSTLVAMSAGPASAEATECTSALPAGSYGHLVVPGGTTCVVEGSNVSGDIRVEPGGTLQVELTTIAGSIIGHDVNRIVVGRSTVGRNIVLIGGQPSSGPPPALIVCATTVGRNVVVQQVTGGIGLRTYLPALDGSGSMTARCGQVRNQIGGNLIVSNNAPVRTLILNNVVHGNMRVVNNTSGGPRDIQVRGNAVHRNMRVVHNTGDGTKEVMDNRVHGSLVCVGNDDPFTADGNSAGRRSDCVSSV